MNDRTNLIKMGKHIAELRKRKNYTQKLLGDILDVSDKTISKWEKGVAAPDITILHSLASTLDVTIEELLSGEEVQTIDTVEAINIYSKITKNKLIKSFIILFIIFMLCVFFVFRIEDYYSWHLTNITSIGELSSDGYILNNNKESKILIKRFKLKNNRDILVKSFVIRIMNEEELIYNTKIDLDMATNINEVLKNHFVSLEINKVIKTENVEMFLSFIDEDENQYVYSLNYE